MAAATDQRPIAPSPDRPDRSVSPLLESADSSRPDSYDDATTFSRFAFARGGSSNNADGRGCDPHAFAARLSRHVQQTVGAGARRFKALTAWQRAVAGSAVAVVLGLAVVSAVFWHWAFERMGAVADAWEHSPAAAVVVWACTFAVSFPPLIGWTSIGTTAGFIFGVWKGWLLFASGTVIGSIVAFYTSQTVLSRVVHRLVAHDRRFTALAHTLAHDGLRLLVLIRLCPLPYSLCNGAVSTVPTVGPLAYGAATALASPKLLIQVFVGSRLRVLTAPDEKVSRADKAVNVLGILVSAAVGILTGVYIYKRTMARARQIEADEANHGGSDFVVHGSGDEEGRIGLPDDIDLDDDHALLDPAHFHDEDPVRDEVEDVFDVGDAEDEGSYPMR